MDLNNEFEVAVPVTTAWAVLTDLERIAPAMPGAQLDEVEGDEYRGQVKVKVGPITASYKGAARFLERDEAAHKAVLKAEGRETRGQGNASATITAQLTEVASGTKVEVKTDLNITGKVAQFGRGVLAEVSGKLLDQFVDNLEKMVLAPEAPAVAASQEPANPGQPGAVGNPGSDPGGNGQGGGSGPVPSPKPRRSRTKTSMPSSTAGDPTGGAIPEAGGAAETADETAAAQESRSGSETDGESSTGGDGSTAQAAPTVRRIDGPPAEPVDLRVIAGDSIAKRILPFASVAGAIFLLRIVIYAMKRRKK